MARNTPEISDIMNKTAQHFEIPVEELTNMKRQSPQHNQARLVAVFVAAEGAGYSNKDVAIAMQYKDASHVSSKFNKAHDHYTLPMDEAAMAFRRDCNAVARNFGLQLEE